MAVGALLCGAVSGCEDILGLQEIRERGECLQPGEMRCDRNVRQKCSESFLWQVAEDCPANAPVCVGAGDCSPIRAVAAGGAHSCALIDADGSVWCWGRNASGELGDGTTSDSSMPVRVLDLPDVTSVALGGVDGEGFSCAVQRGEVYCWGSDSNFQLGDGNKENLFKPQRVTGVSAVEELALGARFACARQVDGVVKCWGWPTFATWNEPTPWEGFAGAEAIAAGNRHLCSLKGGYVFCAGINEDGQCGQPIEPGMENVLLTPKQVPGVEGAKSISAGYFHTCAVVDGNTALCWGRNECGELGRGKDEYCGEKCALPYTGGCGDSVPGPVALSKVDGVDLGGYHSCAHKEDQTVYCWGRNDFFQASADGDAIFGHGRPFLSVPAPSDLNHVKSMSVGVYHGCALMTFGTVRCWGRNDFGQLGVATSVRWGP